MENILFVVFIVFGVLFYFLKQYSLKKFEKNEKSEKFLKNWMDRSEKTDIDFEEFMLHQLDVTLDMKDRLESKTVGYLTSVAFILSVLATLISMVTMNSASEDLKFYFFKFSKFLFMVGILELFICSLILLPKAVSHFDSKDLQKLMGIESDLKRDLLGLNWDFIIKNEKTLTIIRSLYTASSIGLVLLLIGFAVEILFFFKIL